MIVSVCRLRLLILFVGFCIGGFGGLVSRLLFCIGLSEGLLGRKVIMRGQSRDLVGDLCGLFFLMFPCKILCFREGGKVLGFELVLCCCNIVWREFC